MHGAVKGAVVSGKRSCEGLAGPGNPDHISGTDNIADLLPKPHDVTIDTVNMNFPWQQGLPWMTSPLEELPSTQFMVPPYPDQVNEFHKELFVEISDSCASEVPQHSKTLPCLAHLGPHVECSALQIPHLRPAWIAEAFQFIQLGWSFATSLIAPKVEAVWRFCHQEPMPTKELF
jgi:hypothetical protein